MINKLPTPEEFFGFFPGSDKKMIRWDKLCEYYKILDGISDRMILSYVGPSSEGNQFFIIYVSAEENLKKLEHYRDISMRLANPKGLTENEINKLSGEGKAVCMQSYGLHSNEVGGAQMVPIMLYDLITASDGELYDVLQNVVFIISPCSEPDGEIVFTDWYNKYVDTEFDGIYSPYLRHNWAGHSNNRDAIRESLVESRYLNDIMIRQWMPQVFQDHHHDYPYMDRMSIAPVANPVYKSYSPLMLRETAVYGSEMAQALTEAGRRGVVSGAKRYNSFPLSSFHGTARLHNIAGMLTESADAHIASPAYIYPEQIAGYKSSVFQCPDPWEGGEWHLSDIVEQMYMASVSLLKYMAANRKRILKNMAKKALEQTERGKKEKIKAYIIPAEQHDRSAFMLLIDILMKQRIDIYTVKKDIDFSGMHLSEGAAIIPLAQPKYAVINAIFEEKKYYLNDDGVELKDIPRDNANLSLCMGINALPVFNMIDCSLIKKYVRSDYKPATDILDGRENESYKNVNIRIRKNEKIWRASDGNFYTEFADGRNLVKPAKVGLLKKSVTGNEEEGYTRNLLKMYDFDYRIVMDREIRTKGVPKDIDVLIIPGDNSDSLTCGDTAPNAPAEYHTGLGKKGADKLKEFVKCGGRLIVWEESCLYVNEVFNLGLKSEADELDESQLFLESAHIKIDLKKDLLTLGMPKGCTIISSKKVILSVGDYMHKIEVLGCFPKEDILVSGYLRGEKYLREKPCVLRTEFGDGEIILYTFNPEFRVQQDGTFKLLFNALYKMNPPEAFSDNSVD